MALNLGHANELASVISDVGDKSYTDYSLSKDKKALNPMINSGALLVLELLSRKHDIG